MLEILGLLLVIGLGWLAFALISAGMGAMVGKALAGIRDWAKGRPSN
jgi:hypothetical protein